MCLNDLHAQTMAWDGSAQEEGSRAQRESTAHLAEGRQLRGVYIGQQLDGCVLHTVAHCPVHLIQKRPEQFQYTGCTAPCGARCQAMRVVAHAAMSIATQDKLWLIGGVMSPCIQLIVASAHHALKLTCVIFYDRSNQSLTYASYSGYHVGCLHLF